MNNVKRLLEKFYRGYDFNKTMMHDPIEFPYRYKNPADIEASGFIASCFAYGRVGLFKPVIETILMKMGGSPHGFLLDFNVKKHGKLFSGVRYRFNENADVLCLLHISGWMLRKHKSIERVFKSFYIKDDADTGNALTGFINSLVKTDTSKVYGSNIKPDGLIQFFPSPVKGSACKRMNLFLRWMIRDKDIDFGMWNGIPKHKLIIPLDTHIARISRCIGLTGRKACDWKTAVEITNALKQLDPEDPLKYDFAMCHYGISGFCNPTAMNAGNCARGCLLRGYAQ